MIAPSAGPEGVWILADQLHPQQSALASLSTLSPDRVPVILIESHRWASSRNHHQQKLVLVWSAMRHFAQELQQRGYPVTYVEADSYAEPLQTWAKQHQLQQIRLMQPADIPVRDEIEKLRSTLPCPLLILENNHFLWTADQFIEWASGRKRLLLEDFYREGRRRFRILMDGPKPLGGALELRPGEPPSSQTGNALSSAPHLFPRCHYPGCHRKS